MNKLHKTARLIVVVFSLIILTFCTKLQYVFFEKSLRDEYTRNFTGKQIYDEDVEKRWKDSWSKVDSTALKIDLPYSEKGVYSDEDVEASSFVLDVAQGEILMISVNSEMNFFIEIYEKYDKKTLLKSHNNIEFGDSVSLQVKEDTKYLIKLQPALMSYGSYSLDIYRKPKMILPVAGASNSSIQSFFGDPRDGGKRKHKGIDIFAEKGTPVISTMDGLAFKGISTRGGKNIRIHNAITGISTYYAHLDSQFVHLERVKVGDTIGTVGNTGNAKYTSPHLHFGIYKRGIGPVDPYPYVKEINVTSNIEEPSFMKNTRYIRTKNISDSKLKKSKIKEGDVYKVMAVTEGKVRARSIKEHKDFFIPLKNVDFIKIDNEG